jgi:hypothetical protein
MLGWFPTNSTTADSEPPGDSVPDSTPVASLEDNCLPRPTVEEHTAVLRGTTDDDAVWVAGFGIDDRGIQMVCVDITFEGAPAANGRIGGPFDAADDPADIVVAVMNTGRAAGPRWYVVRGTVTADAVRVELSFDDAEPVEAELAATGPEPGWLWYALTVPNTGSRDPHVVATAYDANGWEVAAGEDVFHSEGL